MAGADGSAEVKVYRFDPIVDEQPRYQTYKVPIEGRTVLGVLRYIQENEDPSLAFRFGCAGGGGGPRCGACPVVVNGEPTLSCKKVATNQMTIEPHPKYSVIKDLVVDFDQLNEMLDEKKRNTPAIEIIVDPTKCDGCRDCILNCPVRVYDVQKVDGKGIAVAVDIKSCCGFTCRQCAIFCKNGAITLKAKG